MRTIYNLNCLIVRRQSWLGLMLLLLVFSMKSSWGVAADQSWTIQVKDADIGAFISQISEMTGHTFVIDPRVKGKVTVISKVDMSAEEIYQLFLSVLQVHGYAAVPSGEVIKIIPNNTAKQVNLPVTPPDQLSSANEALVTQVITIKNTPATELVPILRPLVPQYGHLAAVAAANALIVSDHAQNIVRLREILERIDGAESEELEVIQLKEAWVSDVVTLLSSLEPVNTGSSSGKGSGSSKRSAIARVLVVAEERTNRLIIKGEKSARARIRNLVAKLDQPNTDHRTGSNKVIYLRHSEAIKVADILKGLIASGGVKNSSKKNSKTVRDNTPVDAHIEADETLNALVIRADPADIADIEDIVHQLDIRRAQVLIEAVIVEISGDMSNALGVQWASYDPNGVTGAVQFSNVGLNVSQIVNYIQGDTTTAAISEGISLATGEDNDGSGYGVLIQALAQSSNANLLSTPSIMTLDNESAEIVVGQNVPFITGNSTGEANNTANPFQTISREDVGLTLRVIPRIHEGDVIRLKVEQEVSSVVPSTENIDAADLVTNKRSIKTTILADDGETIVLGGLIQDDYTDSESRVPLLGDIPLIGRLFRSSSRTHVKRNLLVFLKPNIIRNQQQAKDFSQSKYQQVRSVLLGLDEQSIFRWQNEKETGSQLPENLDELFRGRVAIDIQD